MNPVIQSSTTPAFSGFATAQFIQHPSGLAVGDLWVAYVHVLTPSGQTVTIPAGWNTLDHINTDYTIYAIWRIATSADVAGATYQVTYSAKVNAFICSLRITGFDPVTPFGTPQHDSIGGVFTWTSSKSVTPAKRDSLVLFSYGEVGSFNSGMGNSGDTAFVIPDGTITQVQWFGGSSGGFNTGTIVYDNRTGVLPTGGWILTPGSTFADWAGTIVVVNPLHAGSGGGDFFPFFE